MEVEKKEKLFQTYMGLLDEHCAIYNAEPSEPKGRLVDMFESLATKIVDSVKFSITDRNDAIQECMVIAFEKIHRFDPKKGKAKNFFATIMMSLLRQIYRTSRNYQELKERFDQHCKRKSLDKSQRDATI